MGMLAAALRGHAGLGAFDDFQKSLLHALARHIAGDGRVFGFAADLVDFVDVDDAALGLLHVVIGRLQEFQNDVLDILAHVTGFGQRGGVDDGEWHVEDFGQGLGHQRFSGTRGADQQHVAFLQFHVIHAHIGIHALKMVVNGDGQNLFAAFLADDVLVEVFENFLGFEQVLEVFALLLSPLLHHDFIAQLDTLVTDVNRGARDQLFNFLLAFAAEGATVISGSGTFLCHSCLQLCWDNPSNRLRVFTCRLSS